MTEGSSAVATEERKEARCARAEITRGIAENCVACLLKSLAR